MTARDRADTAGFRRGDLRGALEGDVSAAPDCASLVEAARRPSPCRGRRPAPAEGDEAGRPRARRVLALIVDYHMHLRAPDESSTTRSRPSSAMSKRLAERGIDEIGFTEHVYYFEQTRPVWSLPYQLDRCRVRPRALRGRRRRGKEARLSGEAGPRGRLPARPRAGAGRDPRALSVGLPDRLDPLHRRACDRPGAGFRRRSRPRAGVGPLLRLLVERPQRTRRPRPPGPDQVHRPGDRVGLGRARRHARRRLPRGLERRAAQAAREALPERRSARGWAGTGLPITLASDAHIPQNVGRDLDRAIEHARAAGYETVTVFEQRQGRQEPLG